MKSRITTVIRMLWGTMVFIPLLLAATLITFLLTYFDTLGNCFPATVVTSDIGVIDRVLNADICNSSVTSERLMIESDVFNDYDMPPVKTIHFMTVEAPHEHISKLRTIPGAVVETNPYLTSAFTYFTHNRVKMTTLLLFLALAGHIIFLLSVNIGQERCSAMTVIIRIVLFLSTALFVTTSFSGGATIHLPGIALSFLGALFYGLLCIIRQRTMSDRPEK